jgi:methylglutaconyl-CoA hydratase
MQTLLTSHTGPVQTVTLHRPEARNAFNEQMIAELKETFSGIADSTRVVVLTGAGAVFCAGADVNWMRDSVSRSESDNRRDAARMESMFRAIDECPCPLVGRINGTALGGGMGLLACCDIAIAADTAQFGFTEVRLGIVPAVISPYSLAKIGPRAARRFFLTGETFDAQRAREIGLVHDVVSADRLDAETAQAVEMILRSGPRAVRTAKALIREVTAMERDESRQHTIATIARVRTSAEGHEGLSAFLEKRLPGWSDAK